MSNNQPAAADVGNEQQEQQQQQQQEEEVEEEEEEEEEPKGTECVEGVGVEEPDSENVPGLFVSRAIVWPCKWVALLPKS